MPVRHRRVSRPPESNLRGLQPSLTGSTLHAEGQGPVADAEYGRYGPILGHDSRGIEAAMNVQNPSRPTARSDGMT